MKYTAENLRKDREKHISDVNLLNDSDSFLFFLSSNLYFLPTRRIENTFDLNRNSIAGRKNMQTDKQGSELEVVNQQLAAEENSHENVAPTKDSQQHTKKGLSRRNFLRGAAAVLGGTLGAAANQGPISGIVRDTFNAISSTGRIVAEAANIGNEVSDAVDKAVLDAKQDSSFPKRTEAQKQMVADRIDILISTLENLTTENNVTARLVPKEVYREGLSNDVKASYRVKLELKIGKNILYAIDLEKADFKIDSVNRVFIGTESISRVNKGILFLKEMKKHPDYADFTAVAETKYLIETPDEKQMRVAAWVSSVFPESKALEVPTVAPTATKPRPGGAKSASAANTGLSETGVPVQKDNRPRIAFGITSPDQRSLLSGVVVLDQNQGTLTLDDSRKNSQLTPDEKNAILSQVQPLMSSQRFAEFRTYIESYSPSIGG